MPDFLAKLNALNALRSNHVARLQKRLALTRHIAAEALRQNAQLKSDLAAYSKDVAHRGYHQPDNPDHDQERHGDWADGVSGQSSSEPSREWAKSLTDDEKEVASRYTSDWLGSTQRKIRRGEALGSSETFAVNILDEAIRKAPPLQGDVTAYRGMVVNDSDNFAKIAPGAVLTDRAFVSVSLSQKEAERFTKDLGGKPILFEVKIPKGTRAPSLKFVSRYPEQEELLLPRGTRFRVRGVTKTDKLERVFVDVL